MSTPMTEWFPQMFGGMAPPQAIGSPYGYGAYGGYRPTPNQGVVGMLANQFGGPFAGIFGGVLDSMINNHSGNSYLNNSLGSQVYQLQQQQQQGLIQEQFRDAFDKRFGQNDIHTYIGQVAAGFGVQNPMFHNIVRAAGLQNELSGVYQTAAAQQIGWMQHGIGMLGRGPEATESIVRSIQDLMGEGGMTDGSAAAAFSVSAASRGMMPGTDGSRGFGRNMQYLSELTNKSMEELFQQLDSITGDLSNRMVGNMESLTRTINTVIASTGTSFDQLMTAAGSIQTQLGKLGIRNGNVSTEMAAQYEFTRQQVNQDASHYGLGTAVMSSMESGGRMLEMYTRQGSGIENRIMSQLIGISGLTEGELMNQENPAEYLIQKLDPSGTALPDSIKNIIRGTASSDDLARLSADNLGELETVFRNHGTSMDIQQAIWYQGGNSAFRGAGLRVQMSNNMRGGAARQVLGEFNRAYGGDRGADAWSGRLESILTGLSGSGSERAMALTDLRQIQAAVNGESGEVFDQIRSSGMAQAYMAYSQMGGEEALNEAVNGSRLAQRIKLGQALEAAQTPGGSVEGLGGLLEALQNNSFGKEINIKYAMRGAALSFGGTGEAFTEKRAQFLEEIGKNVDGLSTDSNLKLGEALGLELKSDSYSSEELKKAIATLLNQYGARDSLSEDERKKVMDTYAKVTRQAAGFGEEEGSVESIFEQLLGTIKSIDTSLAEISTGIKVQVQDDGKVLAEGGSK